MPTGTKVRLLDELCWNDRASRQRTVTVCLATVSDDDADCAV